MTGDRLRDLWFSWVPDNMEVCGSWANPEVEIKIDEKKKFIFSVFLLPEAKDTAEQKWLQFFFFKSMTMRDKHQPIRITTIDYEDWRGTVNDWGIEIGRISEQIGLLQKLNVNIKFGTYSYSCRFIEIWDLKRPSNDNGNVIMKVKFVWWRLLEKCPVNEGVPQMVQVNADDLSRTKFLGCELMDYKRWKSMCR